MPFIDSKVNVKMTDEDKDTIKKCLGQAISLIPGKSENWLMVGFDDDYTMYFRGDGNEKIAYIKVNLYGGASKSAYQKLTEEISNIYNEVLGIPKDKIYIQYEETEYWGWNGSNL